MRSALHSVLSGRVVLSGRMAWRRLVMPALLFMLAVQPLLVQAQTGLRIEQWTTASGARVLFVQAPSIPMLDLNVDFDAGSRFDPAAKAGLASMTMSMLARGIRLPAGEVLDETAIAERFASTGAIRGGGVSDDRASASLRTLTSQPERDVAIELFARLLAYPSFPQAVFDRERARIDSSLKEAESKPETIVRRNFMSLAYGRHPYGVDASRQTIAALSLDDLRLFHRQYFRPDRAVVSMIGAVSRSEAEAIAERLIQNLPTDTQPPKLTFPPVVRPDKAIEKRIEHPASQSHILMGAPAIARGDPDYFALMVGNYVLGGGGFVSRLYDEVREKRGLAYSVYSYFSPSLDPGPFTIGLQTQRERTNEALAVVRSTVARFLKDGPTEAELAAAKDGLVGGFPLRIDSNRKILENIALIGYYRLPADYLETWSSRVEAVTLESVRAAFARHVSLERMITVVVGAAS